MDHLHAALSKDRLTVKECIAAGVVAPLEASGNDRLGTRWTRKRRDGERRPLKSNTTSSRFTDDPLFGVERGPQLNVHTLEERVPWIAVHIRCMGRRHVPSVRHKEELLVTDCDRPHLPPPGRAFLRRAP